MKLYRIICTSIIPAILLSLSSSAFSDTQSTAVESTKWIAVENNCTPAASKSQQSCGELSDPSSCNASSDACVWDSHEKQCYNRNSVRWQITPTLYKIIPPGKSYVINPKGTSGIPPLAPDNRIQTSWVDANGGCGWGNQSKCLVSELNGFLESSTGQAQFNFDAQYGFGMPAGWTFAIRNSSITPGEEDNTAHWYTPATKNNQSCSGQRDQVLFNAKDRCNFLQTIQNGNGVDISNRSNNNKSGPCIDHFGRGEPHGEYSCGQILPSKTISGDSHYYCVTNEPGLFVMSAKQTRINSYCIGPNNTLQPCQSGVQQSDTNYFPNGTGKAYQAAVDKMSNQPMTVDAVTVPHSAGMPTSGWVCSTRRGYAKKAECTAHGADCSEKDMRPGTVYEPGSQNVISPNATQFYCSTQHAVSYEGDGLGFYNDPGQRDVDDQYYSGNVATLCDRDKFDTVVLKICPTANGAIYPTS